MFCEISNLLYKIGFRFKWTKELRKSNLFVLNHLKGTNISCFVRKFVPLPLQTVYSSSMQNSGTFWNPCASWCIQNCQQPIIASTWIFLFTMKKTMARNIFFGIILRNGLWESMGLNQIANLLNVDKTKKNKYVFCTNVLKNVKQKKIYTTFNFGCI